MGFEHSFTEKTSKNTNHTHYHCVVFCCLFTNNYFTPLERNIHLMFGNFNYFIPNGNYFVFAQIQNYTLGLITFFVHYQNQHYKPKQSNSYLRPFKMLSGLITPISIGLFNHRDIFKLVKRSRLLIINTELALKYNLPIVLTVVVFSNFYSNCTLPELMLTIPASIVFIIGTTYFNDLLHWHMIYFYVICLYLQLKQKQINTILSLWSNRNTNDNVTEIVGRMLKVHHEVSQYNKNFWSKFLLWFSFLYTTFSCLLLFIAIYAKFTTFNRIMIVIVTIVLTSVTIILLNSPCSVSSKINHSYYLLNDVMAKNSKWNVIGFHEKFKVSSPQFYSLFGFQISIFILIFTFIL